MSSNKIYVLSEKEFAHADNLPVIVFDYKRKKVDLENFDALIFTSKNGVIAIDKINPHWKKIPSYAIGSGTRKAVEALGGSVVYEAKSSYGDDFAKEIQSMLRGKRVLFLRPKVVTSHLNTILLNNDVKLEEAIVYETKCNQCQSLQKPPEGSFIIFSSPSTIICFLDCFSWDNSYTAIAIGDKTASFMPEDIPFILSKTQTIDACISLAQEIRSKNSP